ncbi:MAG: glycosyltransferase family 2 protein [Thalassotalea sp.]
MKVSIGIPFYNPGKVFKESILTVLNQSFEDFELILLDDGSTDESLTIALAISDPRVRVISDGENHGLPRRLNQLIDLSQGQYIARMDADDLINKDKIAQQVAMLDADHSIDIISTGICSITDNNQVLGYRLPVFDKVLNWSVKDTIFGRVNIAHATILARKSWYQRNRYNPEAKLMEDYQLWLDASIKNDLAVAYLKAPVYFYREESSVSAKKAVNAYKNQFSIVYQTYFNHLNLAEKLKFSMLTLVKIILVKSLNLFKNLTLLQNIRNKKTQQSAEKIKQLQQEVDALRALS